MNETIPELPIRLRAVKDGIIVESNPVGFSNSTERIICLTRTQILEQIVTAVDTWLRLNKL